MNLISFIIVLFAILSINLSAQNPEWVNYSTTNSPLTDNYVRALAIDNLGNKWIGSTGGLVKYDGVNWLVFNTGNSGLPANDVRSIYIQAPDKIWIGTLTGGLAKFDGTSWTVYNTSNSGLPSNGVRGITMDNADNLWIGTWTGGLAKFDGSNWIVYNTSNSGLPFNYVHQVKIDLDDNKWIATDGGGLAKFDGTNWTVYNTSNSGLPHNYVYTLDIEDNNTIWAGTYGGGLAKFDGTNWTVYNTLNSQLPHNNVHYLKLDNLGNKWVGMRNEGGLAKFDGANWEIYNTSNSGLTYNWGLSLGIDDLGNKWIGTYGGGLCVYKAGGVLPVEFSAFTCRLVGEKVQLSWQTISEINNYGFEIQRSFGSTSSWEVIGFVPGNGNSNSPKDYSFTDNINLPLTHIISYRLKQIDNDGQFKFSEVVEIEKNTVDKILLDQNFPNPFNPATTIRFSLPERSFLNLSIYSLTGEKISELLNEVVESGSNEVLFDAASLASGVYFYVLKSPQLTISKKMIFAK